MHPMLVVKGKVDGPTQRLFRMDDKPSRGFKIFILLIQNPLM